MTFTVTKVIPEDDDKGIALLQTITAEFTEAVDIDSVTNGHFLVATTAKNLVASGSDFHYLTRSADLNDDILSSPEFKGILNGNFSFSEDLKTVRFDPSEPMEPNTLHSVMLSKEILTRTIGPIVTGQYGHDNLGTGYIALKGPYEGSQEDTLWIEIVTPGALRVATFRYWYASDPSFGSEPITLDNEIAIEDNITILFAEGDYKTDDAFSAWLKPGIGLDELYMWTFATGSGSLVAPPETDKSRSLIGVTLTEAQLSGSQTTSAFELLSANPSDSAVDVDPDTRTFIMTFNKEIDPTTVSLDNISVMAKPIQSLGIRDKTKYPQVITASASGSNLIIRIIG